MQEKAMDADLNYYPQNVAVMIKDLKVCAHYISMNDSGELQQRTL
jgi:hypothetical protein